MQQTSPLLRRDNVFTDNPFLVKTVVIECIFTAAFLVVAGLCVRVLLRGRGSRSVYALLLSSSIFYILDLVLDLAENCMIVTQQNGNTFLHISQTEAFFGPMAFPILFAAVALAATKRYAFVSGISGRKLRKFDPLVLVGVLIVAWLSITSLVFAGLNMSLFGFEFDRLLEGPAFISFLKQINRINNVGYTRSAALCVGSLFLVFTIVHTYMKMKINQQFHDDVTKWMALLVMPACVLNFLYVLIFTILSSPNVSSKVFLTDASANAFNLADTVISPGVPFLIAFALAAIGLKQLAWNHSTDSTEGFVPMNDWPAKRRDQEAAPAYDGKGSDGKGF